MRRSLRLLVLVPLVVAAAACGSDGSSDDADDTSTDDATSVDDADTDDSSGSDDASGSDDDGDEAPVAPSGGGSATLTLANGETFEFSSLLCSLEPQESAGSEILFTAVSYEDPGLDVTQFGTGGTINDVAAISVYNASYETLWEANSMFGSAVELTLSGSTITGSGTFLEGDGLDGESVEGELVANC
ncbi:MAG: hypothetical protein WBP59_07785 [Ilumatobacteraceae bacterium]